MTDLHPSVKDIEIPMLMSGLPRSKAGWPVPWFVGWVDGEPDFRTIKPDGVELARRHRLCWLCGYELGMQATYVSGPMCGVNRTSAEPPSHHDCATYAARACPFLTRPHARRREGVEGAKPAPGVAIMRNPGVAMLWRSVSITFPRPVDGGVLFTLPEPIRVDWLCEGREATFDEVKESVATGIPLLQAEAQAEGPDAEAALFRMVKDFYRWMPPEPTASKLGVTGG